MHLYKVYWNETLIAKSKMKGLRFSLNKALLQKGIEPGDSIRIILADKLIGRMRLDWRKKWVWTNQNPDHYKLWSHLASHWQGWPARRPYSHTPVTAEPEANVCSTGCGRRAVRFTALDRYCAACYPDIIRTTRVKA